MQPASLVLVFHAVGSPLDTGYKDSLTADELDRVLGWLQAHYQVLVLDELAERRRSGKSLDGLAALTFDDNHRSVAEIALPLAVARGLPATWFLMTAPLAGAPYWRRQLTRLLARGEEPAFRSFLAAHAPDLAVRIRPGKLYKDSKDPSRVPPLAIAELLRAFDPAADQHPDFVTPGEIAALALPGVNLGNHSHRHLVMAGLEPEAQCREIATAAEALSHFPQPRSRLFGVPFGGPGSYDEGTLAATAAAGLTGLAVTAGGLKAADDLGEHPLLSDGAGGLQALVRCLSPALRGLLI